jgi:ferritin-like metal-binding protein YciE
VAHRGAAFGSWRGDDTARLKAMTVAHRGPRPKTVCAALPLNGHKAPRQEPSREGRVGSMTIHRSIVMAMKEKTLDDLFTDTLKDIYYAENKILKALPKMAKAAQSDELKKAFQKHFKETEGQVARLEKVFRLIEQTPKGKKCEAIEGIIEEGAEIMKEFKGAPALDAGLVSAAQAVEHYEIARYGTLKRWAEQMGLDQAIGLLDATLNEEKNTDEALTELADSMVNEQAQAAE